MITLISALYAMKPKGIKGIKLGRPLGSKNKNGNILLPYREQIQQYLKFQLSLSAIQKLINPLLQKPISYNSFKYFVAHDDELCQLRKAIKPT